MIELTLLDLVLVYGLMLLSLGMVRLCGGGEERQILTASLRMVGQLLLIGYILHLVFALDRPLPVMGVLLVMAAAAVLTIGGRVKRKMPRFYRVVGSSLLTGCGLATLWFCYLVIGLEPWYEPRYLIPLAGMIFGNSMNGASLAAERLAEDIEVRRDEIETALLLGSSRFKAIRPILASALRVAMTPTVNSLAAMGIVFLPGMMTGQVLSGTDPMVAVKYQVAIMCVITFAVTVSASMILWQGYHGYFTQADQLKNPHA